MNEDGLNISNDVVLVGCTSQKRSEPAEAKDLYDESPLFRKRRRLTEGHYWGILSAEHGLVDPHERLEPYDTHISERDSEEWAVQVLNTLLPSLSKLGTSTVTIYAGKKYVDPLLADLESEGYEVLDPLRGLGIGERLARLDEMAEA